MKVSSLILTLGLVLTPLTTTLHGELFTPLKDEIANKIFEKYLTQSGEDNIMTCTQLNTIATVGSLWSVFAGVFSTLYFTQMLLKSMVKKQYRSNKKRYNPSVVKVALTLATMGIANITYGVSFRVIEGTQKKYSPGVGYLKSLNIF